MAVGSSSQLILRLRAFGQGLNWPARAVTFGWCVPGSLAPLQAGYPLRIQPRSHLLYQYPRSLERIILCGVRPKECLLLRCAYVAILVHYRG